ncbi:MAG: hypothetical protein ACLFNU_02740 [Bacteroidales bacterium]
MRRILIVFGLLIGIVIIVFLTLRISWSFKDKKELNVYILDKTVTRIDRPKHKSLTWLLKNERFVLSGNKKYSHKKDYYGFFPKNLKNGEFEFKNLRVNEVDEFAETYDALYYADCYGVYSFEWYKGKSTPIRSQKVYGGLNQNDYLLMKSMLDQNKLVIAEYNMFSTPTNALVRSKTENLLGIKWGSWSGKFFETFDVSSSNGPPEWMKNLYESQHIGAWPDDSSGLILISNDGILEILTTEEHLNNAKPIIQTTSSALKKFSLKQDALFEQWFEFISPGKNIVHSTFFIDANPKGIETLKKIGLSPVFPAVIQGKDSNYYYFCGEFTENPTLMWTSKLSGAQWINHALCKYNAPQRAIFFKQYYNPLVRSILNEYYQTINSTEDTSN